MNGLGKARALFRQRRDMLRSGKVGGVKSKPEPRTLHCVHLGEATGEKVLCPPCGGRVRLKLFVCSLHQSCTLQKQVDGHACCQTCEDYAAGA